jgi:hypothetical protein
MTTLDFRKIFFEDIVIRSLGYNPRIEIKPVHLANGFFRAICGGYSNNEVLHMAIYPKEYTALVPDRKTDLLPYGRKLKSRFPDYSPDQQAALRFLNGQEDKRAMLNALLGADKALYRLVQTSSYSLSHASHITTDNHDRDTGLWLQTILSQGDSHPAFDLLLELLMQGSMDRNDELSLITLPLDNTSALCQLTDKYQAPTNAILNNAGLFDDPIIQTIRSSFDALTANDEKIARKNGKLDTLRHFVTLGCFSVFFHLANAGRTESLIPIIFRFTRGLTTLTQASVRSYQLMLRSIDEYLYQEVLKTLNQLDESKLFGSWDDDTAIERHIRETIDWHQMKTPSSRGREEDKIKKLQQKCLNFYHSYRGDTASISPREALAHAITYILSDVLSSTPQDVARGLGTRVGLLSQCSGRRSKTYDPHPDFLEVLVRSSIPPGETWTLHKLAAHWANSYGILCGVLGDENQRLNSLGVYVDQGEWLDNMNSMAELLELSGYARRYADGVVLITVEQ